MKDYLRQFYRHRRRHLFGTAIEQSASAVYVLEEFLYNYKPTCIRELGSGRGTLSTYFKCYCELNKDKVNFRTFDISPRHNVNILDYFENKDVYEHNNIIDICTDLNYYKRPFIYIDALDPKSSLVNLYTPYLKSGVIIAAHDFITNTEKKFRWGFKEDDINSGYAKPFEPYYTMSKELDTRTLYLKVK